MDISFVASKRQSAKLDSFASAAFATAIKAKNSGKLPIHVNTKFESPERKRGSFN